MLTIHVLIINLGWAAIGEGRNEMRAIFSRAVLHTWTIVALLVASWVSCSDDDSSENDLGPPDLADDSADGTLAEVVDSNTDPAQGDADDTSEEPIEDAVADHADDLTPAVCEEATVVATAEDVMAALSDIPYNYLGPYTFSRPVVSSDLQVEGTVTFDGSDFLVPQSCLDRSDCRHEVYFWVSEPLPGITPVGEDVDLPWFEDSPSITVTDALFRLRPLLYDTHPEAFSYVPVLEVLPACDVPCGDNAFKCPEDNVCYDTADFTGEYCRLCLEMSIEHCACWTLTGQEADETECMFMVSGDVLCSGQCTDGLCCSEGCGGDCP